MTTPINAITQRAYTGKNNIATLLNSNYPRQQWITPTQVNMIGYKLKPNAKPFQIIWVNKEHSINEDGSDTINVKLLHHEVYNIDEVIKIEGSKSVTHYKQSGFRYNKQGGSKPMTKKQHKYIIDLFKKLYPYEAQSSFDQHIKKVEGYTAQQATYAISELIKMATPH